MAVLGGNAIDHGFAYAGMVVDAQACNGVSKLNKGDEPLIAGLGVVSDGDDGAKAPEAASTAANFVGVVKYELNRVQENGVNDNAQRDMTVITRGSIWVLPHVGVAKDDPVYLIVATTGGFEGQFSNVTGTGDTLAVLVPNAKWLTTVTVGSLAKISLNVGG